MATFRKRGGKWRVEVARMGIRRSETFDSKGEAVAWAARQEAAIMAGARGDIPHLTFSAVLERYARDVSPSKKGAKWEVHRLEAAGRDRIGSVPLRKLAAPHVADWRDRRLQAVSRASVRREWNLLSHACALAVREWHWLKTNPFREVKRPRDGMARTRVATQDEVDQLTGQASPALKWAIEVALETGMRASEIAGLKPSDVRGRVAVLKDTKNGTSREVPLSKRAGELLTGEWPRLTAGSISGLFARLCVSVGIQDLTFHDLRRTAITRLAAKLTPFELAKMVGHRDLKVTLAVYYKQDAEEVARKL